MSHVDDMIDDTTELFLRAAISERKPVLKSTGFCYNCLEPIDEGVYCDADCATDHEKRETRR